MKEPCEEVKKVERRYEKALDDMEKHYKDVLDKIRAEIEQIQGNEYEVSDTQGNRYKYETITKAEALQIIDKYMGDKE